MQNLNHEPGRAIHIDADAARGADVILRTRAERLIFIGGLALIVLAMLFLGWFA